MSSIFACFKMFCANESESETNQHSDLDLVDNNLEEDLE